MITLNDNVLENKFIVLFKLKDYNLILFSWKRKPGCEWGEKLVCLNGTSQSNNCF